MVEDRNNNGRRDRIDSREVRRVGKGEASNCVPSQESLGRGPVGVEFDGQPGAHSIE